MATFKKIGFTPNDELNISIYGTLSCVIVYRSYKVLKIVIFWPIRYKHKNHIKSIQLTQRTNRQFIQFTGVTVTCYLLLLLTHVSVTN